jgi:hypothetical protein
LIFLGGIPMTGMRLIAVWASIAAALLLVMGWMPLVRWADANPNMAAWVQAVGSVGAILGAVWIGYRQNAHHTQTVIKVADDRQESIGKIARLTITHMAETTANIVALAKRTEDTPLLRSMARRALADAIEPLRTLPFCEVRGLNLVQFSLSLAIEQPPFRGSTS